MPEPRSYRQNCSLAHVLDLVGERWTLLIIRELDRGPKRFTDLEAALAGIGANLLTTRLKRLEGTGLVERVTPTPGLRAYGLTEKGEQLAVAMEDIVLWGFSVLEGPDPESRTRAVWAAMGMRVWMDRQPERPPAGTYAFRVGDERFWVRVGPERSVLRDGEPPYPADASARLTLESFFGLVTGRRALDALDVELTGDAERFAQLMESFRLPPNPSLQPTP